MTRAHERRQHRRFSLRIPVAVLGETTTPRSRDLSESGLFIELSEPRPLGSPLPLRLLHPKTGEAIPAVGKIVRHVFAPNGSFVGVGLRFSHNDDFLSTRVRALLTELAGAELEPQAVRTEEDVAYAGVVDGAEPEGSDSIVLSFEDVDVTSEERADYRDPTNLEALAAQIVDPFSADEGIDVSFDDLDQEASDHLLDGSQEQPVVWPDTVPVLVLGGSRDKLTPHQQRVLAFVDGNNPVEQVARGAGIALDDTLAEIVRLAQRGLVLLPDPSEAVGQSHAAAPARPHSVRSKQLGLWDKARACVTEALAAERAGRPQDAAQLLEQALTLRPPNAVDIHARLALLGLGPLNDLEFAERHAHAAAAFSGDRPQIRRLLRAVRVQRARAKHIPRVTTTTATAPGPRSQASDDPTLRSRRRFTAVLAAVSILAVLGYNTWKYVLPWTEQPEEIETRVAELVPVSKVLLTRGRLVVTVADHGRWVALADKERRIEELAKWAQSTYSVNEVVVADATPMMLARATRGKVRIYR